MVGPLGPPREMTLSLRPLSAAALAHAPGVTYPRDAGVGRVRAPGRGWEALRARRSHVPFSPTPLAVRPQLAGASRRTVAVGLDLARPYPVLHFLRCSPDIPVGCHPPGTKPVEQSSCWNGGSPAHCPSGLAAGWVIVCPSEELGLKVPFIWWGRSAAPKTWTTGTWVPSATGPLYQAQPAADGLHQ